MNNTEKAVAAREAARAAHKEAVASHEKALAACELAETARLDTWDAYVASYKKALAAERRERDDHDRNQNT